MMEIERALRTSISATLMNTGQGNSVQYVEPVGCWRRFRADRCQSGEPLSHQPRETRQAVVRGALTVREPRENMIDLCN